MTWWTKLLRRRRLDQDLTDEIAFHRAMRAGDAGAPAFGNETLIRESTRDLWRFRWIETTWLDIRYALRALRRQPGFTAVVVLTLALGIGANTAVFSVVNGVVLKPLPYPDPTRLDYVMTQFPGLGFDRFGMSLPEYLELREHNRVFESVGAYATGTLTLGGQEPTRQRAAGLTADLLPTLAVPPLAGRWLDEADSRPGADRVVVLSEGVWRREFGGDPAAVGRRVDIDGRSTLIVGVMPRGFDIHDEKIELMVPLSIDPATLPGTRSNHYLSVVGRRKAGVEPANVQADIDRLVAGWRQIVPAGHVPSTPNHGIAVTSLLDDMVGGVRGTLWILQGAVVLVLLIACVNLANLLIARADSRAHEHALRAALGASRWRLLRQLVTEGLVLASIAAIAGTVLARAGLAMLLASYPDALPRVAEVAPDWRVLLFTLVATLIVAVVFGLVPFVHLARDRISGVMRFASARTTAGVARARVRTALIVSEVALAVLLVAGAGLLFRSFVNLSRVDVGFATSELSAFAVSLPGSRYDPAARQQFFQALLTRVRALPGVERAALMTGLPTQRELNASDTDFAHIAPGGHQDTGPAENVDYYQTVSLDYVETMSVPIVAGRGFAAEDVGGAPAVLINEALARKFFADREPLGQRLKRGFDDTTPWFTVIGVVKDMKQARLDTVAGTEIIMLDQQLMRLGNEASGTRYVAVRSPLPLTTLAPQFRRAVAELDARLPVTDIQTMDETIRASVARPQFLLLLIGVMATLALTLAGVGIYGVLAYLVAARSQEIGIRMALGATKWNVVRLVLARGLGATAAGLACGLLASLALTKLLTSLLFDVSPTDPLTLAVVGTIILVVAAAACVVPAWRAGRVNPIATLRS